MIQIKPGITWPLHDTAASRQIEAAATNALPPHTLMRRAGLAVARLALALAPHARTVWIVCGPGNNGGDGLEAAIALQSMGRQVVVTWLGDLQRAPADAADAHQRATAAGIGFAGDAPAQVDLAIDALLGIGALTRGPGAHHPDLLTHWGGRLNASQAPVLAVDVPSGLQADTGQAWPGTVRASHTLSLLTLKPGLFTAQGRDFCADLWFDDLGVGPHDSYRANHPAGVPVVTPTAYLLGAPPLRAREHASHKGSYGDVAVIGGAAGMTGAALLAADAALHAGAGRVFVALLDAGDLAVDASRPELMLRPVETLDLAQMTVVCGCGGGQAIAAPLTRALAGAAQLVLDADALNAIAHDSTLQAMLLARAQRSAATLLTPHPLEAARLLGTSTGQVQSHRLAAAQQLSARFACTVVLKGSGTVIAAPGRLPCINATGNARLATAGTGDVLAGMIGAAMAAGLKAFDAAAHAVYRHGQVADQWPGGQALTAAALARQAAPLQAPSCYASDSCLRP